MEQIQLLTADDITGMPVQNRNGEDLGTIKALMLDIKYGYIAYAVLDFGGFLGMGNKYFALPWRGFTLNTARKVIILEVTEEQLENAEGFDKDNWPDMSDPAFAARIYGFYGVQPYWEAAPR